MNNFWNNGQQFQNNRANAYYPEALNISAQTQSFETPNTQGNFQQEQNTQNQNMGQNPFSNLFNTTQNGGNLFGNLFGNNDLLTSLFASNLFGNNNNPDQKNNILMQALSNMLSPPKKSKPSEENVEKIIDISSTFEDL